MCFDIFWREFHLLEDSCFKSCIYLSIRRCSSQIFFQHQLKLESLIQSNQLSFVDCLACSADPTPEQQEAPLIPFPLIFDKSKDLKHLFNTILPLLASSQQQTLLIVDDLSLLEWLGIPPTEIIQFLRALLHVIREVFL